MPGYANLDVVVSLSKELYSHCTQLYNGGPGGLVSSNIMGTWHLMGKQMPNCPRNIVEFLHKTWTILLWVTSPASRGFASTRLKCLSGAQVSQCQFTRRQQLAAVGRLCFYALCAHNPVIHGAVSCGLLVPSQEDFPSFVCACMQWSAYKGSSSTLMLFLSARNFIHIAPVLHNGDLMPWCQLEDQTLNCTCLA